MYINKIFFVILAFLYLSGFKLNPSDDPARQWPMYRGYLASGVLDQADLPESWNLKTKENIKWRIELPGLGLSSPVVWGDRLFITTAISITDREGLKTGIYGDIGSVSDESVHEWKVYCINKYSGKIRWERTAHKGVPEQKRHPKSSHANCTPATDGNYVVAFFGSEGLYCYDMDGDLIWQKDFGVLKSVFFAVESAEWEFASSPLIYDGKVIIQCDVLDKSFIGAYDITTGNELWKQERDEYPGWSTPNIYFDKNSARIAVNGYKHRGGYDLQTGEEIWRLSGGGDIPIPTPIAGHNMIYFNSAHGRLSPIIALTADVKGEIIMPEKEQGTDYIRWIKLRNGSYMQTMLLYKGLLYNLRWNGSLQCYDALTGKQIYDEKLGRAESFTASPVASDGKIFLVNDKGHVYIVQSGQDFRILKKNSLDDISMVTPAITDSIIYFRTERSLIAVAEE